MSETIKAKATKVDGIWVLRFDCPWCGKFHTHSSKTNAHPPYGEHVSKCSAPKAPKIYFLVPADWTMG